MKYVIIIPGRPVPAARMTRGTKWNKRSKRSLAYQEQVAWAARTAGIPRIKENVQLTVRFFFKDKRHGDLSNLIKSVEDGLQYAGIFNDKQILRYGDTTGIYYGTNERTEIEIKVL